MAKKNTGNGEIQALVDDFTNRLTLVVRRSTLEQVYTALGGDTAPGTRKRGRPLGSKNAPKGKKAGGRRSSVHVEKMAETLLAHVKKNPGQRGEQIAHTLRTDVKTMRLPMLKLIGTKKIKTKGQRRGMMYFAS
jgi:hypothetical protein